MLLTIGVGLAAINTGNNLVYMVFGMMLGFITASGILSEISLRYLEVDWILPQELFSGNTHPIRLILRNTKKKFPSFGIDLECSILSPKGNLEKLNERFLLIPALSHNYWDIPFHPEMRGEYTLLSLKIETQFPFGFFRKYLTLNLNEKCVVYPELMRLKLDALEQTMRESQYPMPLKGAGESFWGMREFSAGDNPRRISWKSSAKQSKLIVLETEKGIEKKILFTMAPFYEWKKFHGGGLESAVSFAASLVLKKFQEGYAVGFISEKFSMEPSFDRKELTKILHYFALLNPQNLSLESIAAMEKESRALIPVALLPLWTLYRKHY